jgi:hypothetical protein
MFRRKAGRTKLIELPKANSVAISNGEWLKLTGTGRVTPAVGDTNELLIGVSRDSYASDTTAEAVSIEVPLELMVEWEFDTDSDGGLTDTHVGAFLDLDTLGANVDVSSSVQDTILVVRRISATKGVGVLARGAAFNYGPAAVTT